MHLLKIIEEDWGNGDVYRSVSLVGWNYMQSEAGTVLFWRIWPKHLELKYSYTGYVSDTPTAFEWLFVTPDHKKNYEDFLQEEGVLPEDPDEYLERHIIHMQDIVLCGSYSYKALRPEYDYLVKYCDYTAGYESFIMIAFFADLNKIHKKVFPGYYTETKTITYHTF